MPQPAPIAQQGSVAQRRLDKEIAAFRPCDKIEAVRFDADLACLHVRLRASPDAALPALDLALAVANYPAALPAEAHMPPAAASLVIPEPATVLVLQRVWHEFARSSEWLPAKELVPLLPAFARRLRDALAAPSRSAAVEKYDENAVSAGAAQVHAPISADTGSAVASQTAASADAAAVAAIGSAAGYAVEQNDVALVIRKDASCRQDAPEWFPTDAEPVEQAPHSTVIADRVKSVEVLGSFCLFSLLALHCLPFLHFKIPQCADARMSPPRSLPHQCAVARRGRAFRRRGQPPRL